MYLYVNQMLKKWTITEEATPSNNIINMCVYCVQISCNKILKSCVLVTKNERASDNKVHRYSAEEKYLLYKIKMDIVVFISWLLKVTLGLGQSSYSCHVVSKEMMNNSMQ